MFGRRSSFRQLEDELEGRGVEANSNGLFQLTAAAIARKAGVPVVKLRVKEVITALREGRIGGSIADVRRQVLQGLADENRAVQPSQMPTVPYASHNL